jgi:transposase
MVVGDGQGLPLGILTASASPAEVTLLIPALEAMTADPDHIRRLIADKAYDSDRLRLAMEERGIDLIVPHRRNRKRPPMQDGRKLRRYRRRWMIERLISWLGNWRRLLLRWERNVRIYQGFLHLVCAMTVMKRVVGL